MADQNLPPVSVSFEKILSSPQAEQVIASRYTLFRQLDVDIDPNEVIMRRRIIRSEVTTGGEQLLDIQALTASALKKIRRSLPVIDAATLKLQLTVDRPLITPSVFKRRQMASLSMGFDNHWRPGVASNVSPPYDDDFRLAIRDTWLTWGVVLGAQVEGQLEPTLTHDHVDRIRTMLGLVAISES